MSTVSPSRPRDLLPTAGSKISLRGSCPIACALGGSLSWSHDETDAAGYGRRGDGFWRFERVRFHTNFHRRRGHTALVLQRQGGAAGQRGQHMRVYAAV